MTTTGFPPLHTERLVIRPFRADDVATLVAYRNDAETARYQDWDVPYTPRDGDRLVAGMASAPWPLHGDWYQIAIEHEGVLVGDIGVERSECGKLAVIGYTLAPGARGRGLATEAVGAVVDLLFAEGVHRLSALLDPDNFASAGVVERLGFRYEGRTVGSVLVRGEFFDDELYGLTAPDRRAWVGRDLASPGSVELVEITEQTQRDVARLETHHSQLRFVAPVVWSYGDALFPEHDQGGGLAVLWMRAVTADEALAAFVMVAEVTPTNPDPFLWRLLVDRWHQGRGIGRRALTLLAAQLLTAGHQRLTTSWCPGPGSPEGFYLRLGFSPTGEVIDEEIVGTIDLTTLNAAG